MKIIRRVQEIYRVITLVVLSVSLFSCASNDEVVFITKSSLSIAEIETTPTEISVGYSRLEGYLAPAYENGALPPVVSSIRTDGGLFSPEIQQLYATGEAANLVASQASSYDYTTDSTEELKGEKSGMFFGTSTNLGFKIGLMQDNPSLNIGYKRIEASFIPLGAKGTGDSTVDVYPSVIASIDTTIPASSALDPNPDGLQVGQYFATGSAAKIIATKDFVQSGFENKAQSSILKYRQELAKQNQSALHTLKCASFLTDDEWPQVLSAATTSKLLTGLEAEIAEKWNSYISDSDPADKTEAIQLYSVGIASVDGSTPSYSAVLEAHRSLVCSLI
jgi:hypothetical protein